MDEHLAIFGATPTFPDGMPTWPMDDPKVRQILDAAYSDGNWGKYHGQYCDQLRELVANYHDVPYVQLCCSGTIGVELALRSVGVTDKDEVILAGYDFSGNFRAIENIGARPVLIDVKKNGWTIQPDLIRETVSKATRAILVSHLHSDLASMPDIVRIAKTYGIAVVEDTCQAVGASVSDKTAGTWGDVSVLSFGGSKLLTSGRGGAIFTEDESVFQRAKIYCERGNDAFALSELQAAVLIPQIQQLAERNAKRRDNAAKLIAATDKMDAFLARHTISDMQLPSYYKVGWLLDLERHKSRSRESFINAIRAEGVDLNSGFRGFTKRSVRRCRKPVSLFESETASQATVVLHHPILLKPSSNIDSLIAALEKVGNAWIQGVLDGE